MRADPAGIAENENAATVVTGELGHALRVPCLASEDRTLFVFWYHGTGKGQLLHNDAVYGMTRNSLVIRSLAIDTLGWYTCQAYNSKDVEAPRMFLVQAYMPDGTSPPDSNWLVPRDTAPTSVEETTTTSEAEPRAWSTGNIYFRFF